MWGFWTLLFVALSKTDLFKNSTLLLWCLIITSRNYITILWPNNCWLDNHNKRQTKTDHPNKEVRTPIAKAFWWKTLSIPIKGTELRSIFQKLLHIPGVRILKQFDAIFCQNPSLNCIVCEWCQRRKPKHSPSAARMKLVRAVTQFLLHIVLFRIHATHKLCKSKQALSRPLSFCAALPVALLASPCFVPMCPTVDPMWIPSSILQKIYTFSWPGVWSLWAFSSVTPRWAISSSCKCSGMILVRSPVKRQKALPWQVGLFPNTTGTLNCWSFAAIWLQKSSLRDVVYELCWL